MSEYVSFNDADNNYDALIVMLFKFLRGPTADHWALASGLPTYVAENALVSTSINTLTPNMKDLYCIRPLILHSADGKQQQQQQQQQQ